MLAFATKFFTSIIQLVLIVYLLFAGKKLVNRIVAMVSKHSIDDRSIMIWATIRLVGFVVLGVSVIEMLNYGMDVLSIKMFLHSMPSFETYVNKKSFNMIYFNEHLSKMIYLMFFSLYLITKGKAVFKRIAISLEKLDEN